MIYLILAIILSTSIMIAFKIFERLKINISLAIVTNYLIAASLGFFISDHLTVSQVQQSNWFYFAIVSGIFLIITFYLFAFSAQKVGIAITSVSGKMSVVIPICIGILFYKESVNLIKITGIVCAVFAFYLTFYKKNNNIYTKKNIILFLFPFLLFLGNGINDSLLKHAEKYYIDNNIVLFLSTAFLFSFIIGLFILLVSVFYYKVNIRVKNILAGIILGLLNWGSTLYFLKSLRLFENMIVFPVFNVSVVGLTTLFGYFMFKERLSKINWIGIILATGSIILITFAIEV